VIGAAIATVDIGRSGAWVGPLIVGMLAGALDYSAAGAGAWRDRVAVAGYYACAVSMSAILGWTDYIRGAVAGDYNWTMIGAVISLITHGALLLAMFGTMLGPTRAISKQMQARVKFASGDSKAAKINQTLLGWTVAAAASAPLSGDAGWGSTVDLIATGCTGLWGGIVGVVMHWLGG
jgi:hypothetical protein